MQKLKVYQSLWAMELRGPDGFEHSDETRFQMIADAGYAGVCLDPTADEIQENLARNPLFEKHGLECMINAFPKTDDDLKSLLGFAKQMNATTVSIIGTLYPISAAEAVPIIRRWIEISNEMNVPILFETHRDCITNDMFMTLQIMESVPEMRLCADFSHYVLGRELSLPMTDEFAAYFDRMIERSDCFQGRIASREQIQIPIGFKQHVQWVELFKSFWTQGIKAWRARNDKNADMVFLCELGPPPYAITDGNGLEMSDRWEEALIIKSCVEEIWKKTGK